MQMTVPPRTTRLQIRSSPAFDAYTGRALSLAALELAFARYRATP